MEKIVKPVMQDDGTLFSDPGCLGFSYENNIRKTSPCNVYPLEPHFYIAKLGYAGVYLFFLFLPRRF